MANQQERKVVPEMLPAGKLIRDTRKSLDIPIPRIVKKVDISASEWRELEAGTLRVSFSTLTSVLDLLHIPLQTIFNTKKDDFFPFIRLAMGKEPRDLGAAELDEMHALYLDLLTFRRMRSTAPGRS